MLPYTWPSFSVINIISACLPRSWDKYWYIVFSWSLSLIQSISLIFHSVPSLCPRIPFRDPGIDQAYHRLLPYLSDVFLMAMLWGRNIAEVRSDSSRDVSRMLATSMIYNRWCWPSSANEVAFAGELTAAITSPTHLYRVHFGRVLPCPDNTEVVFNFFRGYT